MESQVADFAYSPWNGTVRRLLAEVRAAREAEARLAEATAEAQESFRVLSLAPEPHPETWEWRHRYIHEWLPLKRETVSRIREGSR
jgi:hypothetical protein